MKDAVVVKKRTFHGYPTRPATDRLKMWKAAHRDVKIIDVRYTNSTYRDHDIEISYREGAFS